MVDSVLCLEITAYGMCCVVWCGGVVAHIWFSLNPGMFQAKQKSKTNKWKCVCCNEKQSVKRCWAQSENAKDVRLG